MTIRATRIGRDVPLIDRDASGHLQRVRVCARCGVRVMFTVSRPPKSPLCQDCKGVLTALEQERWVA